ncbi:MAG: hypothetical protein K2X38_22210 [Gemmataceae bacterium]|nr:hypothetical protein [Gemmataceae bacterium]
MFDPTIGRWISQDPLGFEAGDANLYRYVNNRPQQVTDPSGLVGGRRHHAYPLFLGGSNNQPAFFLESVAAHNEAHKVLARYGMPVNRPDDARRVWLLLSATRRRQIIIESLKAAGVPRLVITRNMERVVRGALPGTAVARIAGYPGGILTWRSTATAAAGTALRGFGILALNPYSLAIQEVLANPAPLAAAAHLEFEILMRPPSSPDRYFLPLGTYIQPDGFIYIPLPEAEYGESDYDPPEGTVVVTRNGRIDGDSVRHGAAYPADSTAPAVSRPWVMILPDGVTEEQARREYRDDLTNQANRSLGNGGRHRTFTFEEFVHWRYGPRRP